jgi:hypothetical protein
VLVFLLDEPWVDFALVLWDGTGGKSSPNPMGGRWCEVDFDRGRSRTDTSSTGGDSCPAFARLCWDGRLATGCVTGEDFLCVISLSVVAVTAGGSACTGLLEKQPIGRRKDER